MRDLLGHASITTTERYDNQTLENLQAAALKLESGKSFDASDAVAQKTASMTGTKFQDSFKIRRKSRGSTAQNDSGETGPNAPGENELGIWLGGRDLNPDNVVQSHVSYR